MRTKILSALKVSFLALVLSFGLSYVYAWSVPTATPPGGNVPAPINTSATAQTKSGGLTVGSISAPTHCIGTDCRNAWPSGGGGLSGSGTLNYIPKWTGASSVGNSAISQDTSNNVSIMGHYLKMANSANSTFYGNGTNTATRQAGGFFVQNAAGSNYAPVYAHDYYIASVGKWASSAQSRVTGSCAVGQAITAINADGTVTCGAVGGGSVTFGPIMYMFGSQCPSGWVMLGHYAPNLYNIICQRLQ